MYHIVYLVVVAEGEIEFEDGLCQFGSFNSTGIPQSFGLVFVPGRIPTGSMVSIVVWLLHMNIACSVVRSTSITELGPLDTVGCLREY